MDRRDFEDIDRFLASVGRTSLYVYYGLEPYAAPVDVENAVRKRRNWAQGQQSNPKYKAEALYLIKNNALIRRILLDEADAYRVHAQDASGTRHIEILTLYIKGAVANGVLTKAGEAAIHHQGRQLGLGENVIADRIDAVLHEIGATRAAVDSVADGVDGAGVDHYMLLDVPEDASPEQIESAYRKRYRWARSLKDLNRSTEILQALDAAWRVLRDPAKRARYDALRAELQDLTDEVEIQAARLLGMLATSELDGDPASQPSPGAPEQPSSDATPVVELPRIYMPVPAHDEPARAGSSATLSSGPPVAESAEQRPAPAKDDPNRVRAPREEDAHAPTRARTPRLSVLGPDVVHLRAGADAVPHRLTVKNAGHGRMPGRVTVDREWISVPNARLDPNATTQAITLLVDSSALPWGLSTGTVTITTEHGERRTLTVQVRRSNFARFAAIAVAGASVLVAVVTAWEAYAPAPETTEVQLQVDPRADRILVDDVFVGSGASAIIAAPSAEAPFRLRIETDGFAPHEELMTVPPRQRLKRNIALALDDAMDWTPPSTPARALRTDEISRIEATAAAMTDCFGGVPAEADYELYVSSEGRVRNLSVRRGNFDVSAAQPCIQRAFRVLRLENEPGSWAKYSGRLQTPGTGAEAGR